MFGFLAASSIGSGRVNLGPCRWRQPQQPLAAPNPNDADPRGFAAVDDPKRWVNQFAQEGLSELGNDAPDIRVSSEDLDPFEDLADEAVSDVRHPFFGVPRLNPRQVAERGLGETDFGNGHSLFHAEPGLGVGEGDLPPLLQVCQAFHNGAHEGALLLGLLEIGDRLHDGHAAAPARE